MVWNSLEVLHGFESQVGITGWLVFEFFLSRTETHAHKIGLKKRKGAAKGNVGEEVADHYRKMALYKASG